MMLVYLGVIPVILMCAVSVALGEHSQFWTTFYFPLPPSIHPFSLQFLFFFVTSSPDTHTILETMKLH